MAIDLPVVGQQNWGEPLNASLRDMDVTRPGSAAEVELSARLSAAAGSAEGMVQAAITASRPILYGTGFPNGKVVAPVGTLYSDEAVTNGASLWQKISGTGNTGWVVVRGDTGGRNVSSLLEPDLADLTKPHTAQVRRTESLASIFLSFTPKVTGQRIFTAPAGFIPYRPQGEGAVQEGPLTSAIVVTSNVAGVVTPYYSHTTGRLYVELQGVPVSSDWPSTLPGTN